jgi:hypothetical protein
LKAAFIYSCEQPQALVFSTEQSGVGMPISGHCKRLLRKIGNLYAFDSIGYMYQLGTIFQQLMKSVWRNHVDYGEGLTAPQKNMHTLIAE